ncbi:MAG: aminodeoxychorismate/anthranilate synthase component II [Actinobacteria bacterium]|jgi:anthranilate synthase/aminodeoxychorismate synthase-like glutamine amidotransferase|nr:aminodeoxychorismate/anthranilate synthase component II [Actinomycetota bacterium]
MIILIDNYDSFTYNLYQYMMEVGAEVKVYRNDEKKISEIEKLNPEKLVVSPGPSNPENAGISERLIKVLSAKIPILGVCLGHQCIGSTFGAKVAYAGEIKHGKISSITHDGKGIFKNIKNPLKVVRYHSLAILEETIPQELEVSARSESGVVMGVRHKRFDVEGIQFHPESIFTESGKEIIKNFLDK